MLTTNSRPSDALGDPAKQVCRLLGADTHLPLTFLLSHPAATVGSGPSLLPHTKGSASSVQRDDVPKKSWGGGSSCDSCTEPCTPKPWQAAPWAWLLAPAARVSHPRVSRSPPQPPCFCHSQERLSCRVSFPFLLGPGPRLHHLPAGSKIAL